ncbi:MAG: hypothetical protein K9K66_15690 [Desulfarculaceae bacterium]|nr:hypothetical protein [Desulfarculaceae bacterium]MCF8073575.1 hypothetical protein [Desulfarculaceae bacterium]MCF8103097.1 hypothetical protein [Desulfarculaceae bacterium]MCF8115709.1 hypothetical protein [Desulfarculaceae bacterium]
MSGPHLTRCLAALLMAALLAVLAPAGALAQECASSCDQFLSSEGLTGAEARDQCIQNCQKLKKLGIEGVSIKCAYELPKTCGYELAWDLIRYCIKPCIEFKKTPCEDCLVKHGFCGAVSVCRKWVCKCILKNHDCDHYYHKGCKK